MHLARLTMTDVTRLPDAIERSNPKQAALPSETNVMHILAGNESHEPMELVVPPKVVALTWVNGLVA